MKPYLLLLLVTFVSRISLANEIDDLYDLSLEDLLNITVSVASSQEESILKTPAIVSTYTQKDMERLGLSNLKELLSFIPGFFVNDGTLGNTFISIRGLHEDFNQKVLFLLDDVPYWMTSHSDIPFSGIPREAIDRVEVIRGPGTLYHGSNSSAGVVKVITKKSDEKILSLQAGSNELYNGSGYFNKQISSDHSLSLSFEKQNHDGYQETFSEFDGSVTSKVESLRKEEISSALLKYNLKTFNFVAHIFETEKTGLHRISPLIQPTDFEYSGYLLHVDNTWELGSQNIKLYYDYNKFDFDWIVFNNFGGNNTIASFEDDGDRNYRSRGGITYEVTYSENIKGFFGAELEERSTGKFNNHVLEHHSFEGTVIPRVKRTEASIFGQMDVEMNKWRYVLGVRVVDNEEYGHKTLPRASIIYQIDIKSSLKLLYSSSYNSPNFRQTNLDVSPNLVGNVELKPEVVESYDLAYTHVTDKTLFVINLYYMDTEDFIQREGAEFINSNDITMQGVEFDFQYNFEDSKLYFNGDYIHKKDSVSARDEFNLKVPDYSFSIGYMLGFYNNQSAGVSLRRVGEMRHQYASKSKINGYNLLNFDYRYTNQKWEYFLTFKNILDERIAYPDLGIATASNEFTTEGSPGRNILAGVEFRF